MMKYTTIENFLLQSLLDIYFGKKEFQFVLVNVRSLPSWIGNDGIIAKNTLTTFENLQNHWANVKLTLKTEQAPYLVTIGLSLNLIKKCFKCFKKLLLSYSGFSKSLILRYKWSGCKAQLHKMYGIQMTSTKNMAKKKVYIWNKKVTLN